MITTIHDITNTQVVVDAPHKDLRRARASSLSLIPTSTGSATAIGLIYPELLGKLTGIAVRVPLLNASLTDCVFEVTTAHDDRRDQRRLQARGTRRAGTGFSDTRSARSSPSISRTIHGPRLSMRPPPWSWMARASKSLAWYDNEIGYVHRLIELAEKVGATL